MLERTRATIVIYSPTGDKIEEVLITPSSKRVEKLMQEDYITLCFALGEAKHFPIGSYVDDELFGRFYVTTEQMPRYESATGGYSYELRMNAWYYVWQSKMAMLTSRDFSTLRLFRKESEWHLCDRLENHIREILRNLQALGYVPTEIDVNNNTDYYEIVDVKKSVQSLLVNYSSLNIIGALNELANIFETEWRVIGTEDNFVIRFGKCASGESIDIVQNVNAESISANRDTSIVGEKLFYYGATENIPVTYRKNVQMRVINVETFNEYDDRVYSFQGTLDGTKVADLTKSNLKGLISEEGGYQDLLTIKYDSSESNVTKGYLTQGMAVENDSLIVQRFKEQYPYFDDGYQLVRTIRFRWQIVNGGKVYDPNDVPELTGDIYLRIRAFYVLEAYKQGAIKDFVEAAEYPLNLSDDMWSYFAQNESKGVLWNGTTKRYVELAIDGSVTNVYLTLTDGYLEGILQGYELYKFMGAISSKYRAFVIDIRLEELLYRLNGKGIDTTALLPAIQPSVFSVNYEVDEYALDNGEWQLYSTTGMDNSAEGMNLWYDTLTGYYIEEGFYEMSMVYRITSETAKTKEEWKEFVSNDSAFSVINGEIYLNVTNVVRYSNGEVSERTEGMVLMTITEGGRELCSNRCDINALPPRIKTENRIVFIVNNDKKQYQYTPYIPDKGETVQIDFSASNDLTYDTHSGALYESKYNRVNRFYKAWSRKIYKGHDELLIFPAQEAKTIRLKVRVRPPKAVKTMSARIDTYVGLISGNDVDSGIEKQSGTIGSNDLILRPTGKNGGSTSSTTIETTLTESNGYYYCDLQVTIPALPTKEVTLNDYSHFAVSYHACISFNFTEVLFDGNSLFDVDNPSDFNIEMYRDTQTGIAFYGKYVNLLRCVYDKEYNNFIFVNTENAPVKAHFHDGVTFTIYDADDYGVEYKYFVNEYDDPSTIKALGERRLMLPRYSVSEFGKYGKGLFWDGEAIYNAEDIEGATLVYKDGYIIRKEDFLNGISKHQREVSVADSSVYPDAKMLVKGVYAEEAQEIQEIEGANTERIKWKWTKYSVQLRLPSSDEPYEFNVNSTIGDGLKMRFLIPEDMTQLFEKGDISLEEYQTMQKQCLLSGMQFAVEYFKSRTYDDVSQKCIFTFARNNDFGAKLPNDTLFPQVGDPCVLVNWDVKALGSLGLIAEAEYRLLRKAFEYYDLIQEGSFSFECTMMSDFFFKLADVPVMDNQERHLWAGDKGLYVSSQGEYRTIGIGQSVVVHHGALRIPKSTRVIGYELKLDKPYDTPKLTVGETETYSRIKQIEKDLTKLTR